MLSPRWSWQPDKWERLSTVAGLAGEAVRVLDVGGRGSEMQTLMPGSEVVSLNIEEPADVVVTVGPLPYDAGAFDVVTSSDVLEHIPPEQRAGHVAELVRVAARRVVVSFPAGSPGKDVAEQELAALLDTRYGVRFDFLDEHLACGLPRAAEVADLVLAAEPSAQVTTWFHDGIEDGDRLLVDYARATRRADPLAAARVARAWVRRPVPELTSVAGPENNRAFVVVDKAPALPGQNG